MSEAPRPRWHQRARHALGHSLRLRLVAVFVLLALGMAGVFIAGMQSALSLGWRDAARPLLSDYVDRLAAEVGTPPSVVRAQALAERLPLRVQIDGPQVRWSSDGWFWDAHGPADAQRRWAREREREEEASLLERQTADGHRIRFGLSLAQWRERPRLIGWATLGALMLLTVLAYAWVRRLLRPLDAIRAGVQRFGAGDFAQPIALRGGALQRDELGTLAQTINTMAHDIAQMLDAKRALLLAISHELRSPLTRARLHAELLPEDDPAVQPAREALLRELALMRDQITDLLESERLAQRHAALQREPVHLPALAHELLASQTAFAPPAVELQVATELPIAALDAARVRLLLRNLLANAVRHNPAAAPAVLLRLSVQDGALLIEVRDFGVGVPPEQLAHLSEPFYRPDAARRREDGGVGLGLYLCRLVAQAHGGRLELSNAQPGLRAQVWLPLQR